MTHSQLLLMQLVDKTSGKLKGLQKKKNPSREQIEKEGQVCVAVYLCTGTLDYCSYWGVESFLERRRFLNFLKAYLWVYRPLDDGPPLM